MNPSIQLKNAIPLFLLALACFGLPPGSRAVTPPPDGGYPNQNTAEGDNALFDLTTGTDNTAIGFQALFSNTAGYFNTATGSSALSSNTTGFLNTATGEEALGSNTTGNGNTAIGVEALELNITGSTSTAIGVQALVLNRTGYNNTANGGFALVNNITGRNNTANGLEALYFNVNGSQNTATGVDALFNNNGSQNTANGGEALNSNTTGNGNTANGARALKNNTTGSRNIALGTGAGSNLTTGSDNIDIGNPGVAGESGQIRIGRVEMQNATFIAGIRGVTVAKGVEVVVGFNGQLGTMTSSARFKEAIKPMDKASEAILGLKPVTFRYKKELDPDGIPQFGLLAEQVEKVNSNLVVRDEDGKLSTVRYEAVNAMLLNEFLKEHSFKS